MQESPFPTSSSSQECLVDLIQPVGRHKQGSGIHHLAFWCIWRIVTTGRKSFRKGFRSRARRCFRSQAMLKEQGQAMLQEVHAANAEFLRVFNRIEQNSHSMLGLVDRIVKVMEANNKS
ncbi:hypothetical protein F7725_000254 [Dissostichus mawsoni]|uniref:Uncharacterized protein n=1 Tax=Dissostichus mawsoni TaxID=36200 RepID=A0A7J5ZG81_DISMA|nr:hypothetical protein F7725_000254 [Dissostichus mawsoni]